MTSNNCIGGRNARRARAGEVVQSGLSQTGDSRQLFG